MSNGTVPHDDSSTQAKNFAHDSDPAVDEPPWSPATIEAIHTARAVYMVASQEDATLLSGVCDIPALGVPRQHLAALTLEVIAGAQQIYLVAAPSQLDVYYRASLVDHLRQIGWAGNLLVAELTSEMPALQMVYAAAQQANASDRDRHARREAAGEPPLPRVDHFEMAVVQLFDRNVVKPLKVRPAARRPVSSNGHGDAALVPDEEPECPPLPDIPDEDPELVARLAEEASPWLESYLALSRQWAPRAYDDFHEACGLFVLSTVAARRVRLEFGADGTYPSLYLALTARTSLWTKTTAAAMALGLLRQAGLTGLLAPDDATPQAFLRGLVARIPDDYDELSSEARERLRQRLAFAAQRGWFYEEFGQHPAAMMQRDGIMASFRGLLRRLDDHKETLRYDTVGRGLDDIEKPYLSLLATLTPADLQPFARPHSPLWSDGYFARFGFVTAPLTEHKDDPYPAARLVYPQALVTALRRWHERLGVPEVSVLPTLDKKSQPTGRYRLAAIRLPEITYQLEDAVREAYYRYDAALRQLISTAETPDLDGSYARFPAKALRVAGLLASLEDPADAPCRTIQRRHWYRGRAIVERWRASLHRLRTQLAEDIPEASRQEQLEQRIERALRQAGPLSMRELRRRVRGAYGELYQALKVMLMAGVVYVAEEKSGRTTRYGLIYQSSNGHGPQGAPASD